MSGQDCEQLTLFREDFPASHFPWLESVKVKGTSVTCGRKCSELSEKLSRVGYFVRTYLESFDLPGPGWSRTWSVKDTTLPCLILKLRLSERRKDGSASPLSGVEGWMQNIQDENGQPKMWKTPVAADSANREFYRNSRGEPNLSGMVKIWPTPAARDAKGSNSVEHLTREGERNHTDQLANAVMFATPRAQSSTGKSHAPNRQGGADLQTQVGGQLNPDWVEWLMGYPIGWTSLTESRE